MIDTPLSYDDLDAEAVFLRPLLRRPPWRTYGDKEDTGIHALFRRYRPGTAPHTLSPELRGAVWGGTAFVPDALKDNDAGLIRAVDHAALVLHLLARGPAASPNGLDFGKGCSKAGLSDTRFTRLMGTPQPRRLEALSRVMQRLEKAGTPLRWVAEDAEMQSRPWNAHLPSTDEVWPMLNFLFGYEPDPSIARWAAGFFGTRDAEATEPAVVTDRAT